MKNDNRGEVCLEENVGGGIKMVSENRVVNVGLYDLIERNETQVHIITRNIRNQENKIGIVALINFCDLQYFVNVVGCNYFTEGGINTALTSGCVAVRIDDIITEYFGHEIKAYKDAIGNYTYKQYLKYRNYWEGNKSMKNDNRSEQLMPI